jgi:multidrug resistance efflux pump
MADALQTKSPGTKIREDLSLSRQEQRGTVYFIVKDPSTRRFFRFKEPEEFIIRQLDGENSPETIREKFHDQFTAALPADTLSAFIGKLGSLGLLEDGTQTRNLPVRRSLFYLRFKLFDPDRLLAWLLPKTRFFFTRSFLWFSAALVFLAIILTAVHSGEIARETPQLYGGGSLLLIWLTIVGIACTHEFSHGLTCKRYGGEVREMGFMLILLFLPAFYCNVSDAWLFPEKRQKLIVLFAGVYWQILLWAAATVLWQVTATETVVHHVALIVMAVCGTYTFFNLNPLIRLDGYYLLSDYLEIPNLRTKALSYLGAAVKNLRGTAGEVIAEVTPRERKIYLIYGLLSGTYIFLLLSFIAFSFGSFLVGRYQGLGFIIFTGILMTLFRNRLKKMFLKFLKPLALPEMGSLMKGRPAKIGVLVVVLAVLWLGRMELRVSGDFTVLPIHNADVRAQVEGLIEKVHVGEGDLVQEGDLIAQLSDRDYRSELRKIEAQIQEREAQLKMLRAGPRDEEIELARKEVETAQTRQEHSLRRYQEAQQMQAEGISRAEATVEKAQERLNYARSYLGRFEALIEEKVVSRMQIEEAREQVAVREQELKEAQAEREMVLADDFAAVQELVAVAEKEEEEAAGRLAVLLMGSRPEEIEATQAEVSRLEAQRLYLEEQLELSRIVSPSSGIITTPKLKERVGQYLEKGELIAEVFELETIRAEIPIPEKEIADVKVGQEVVLKARSYPGESVYGRVTSIAPMARADDTGLAGKTILVTTELENSSLLLKPEMTGTAKIYCGKRRILDLMTRRLARYFKVEFWSYW